MIVDTVLKQVKVKLRSDNIVICMQYISLSSQTSGNVVY